MAKLEHEKSTGYERKVRAYFDSQDRTNEPSGSAEKVIIPLLDRRNSTPPPFNISRVNSFDDHNEESAEVKDGSTEAPPVIFYSFRLLYYAYKFVSNQHFSLKSNDRYESNAGIAREGDNNPFIAQMGEDSMKIRCLSSIMYCNEFKPEYVECSEKTWNGARPRSLILKELPTVADLVIIEYNRVNIFLDEDKDIFDCVQIVSRNFFTYLSSVSYNENKKLDEDTFIYRYCYQILEEIFNQTELSLVWANGESESSKERRLLDGHNHGRKPDFWILSMIDDIEREFIFGEIKPPHCPNTINKSIIKLSEFMKGFLDFIINNYGYVAGLETYSILICGKLSSLLKLC
ncbi:hypothetical protein F8M41_013685 [Gigaspora margarita]|uniref:Uncharacterized protein n=1 Tax=Gigaspora margarita TaxID=4874 RepID=A0A8H3WWE2_GIGMA|nr:hypothetical protein F8M41_013685 [Gigaspora margarita]